MWTVYGKVKKIVKYSPLDTTASDSIVFEYDPLGNRLEKRNYIHQLPLCHVCLATPISDTVKYIRDASGNILAVYDRKRDTVRLTELDLYGSKRIGVIDTVMRMKKPSVGYGPFDSLRIAYLEGQRQYELTTHLGNVLATVSDRKIPIDTNSLGYAQYYLANVINAQDYYPFGMIEPGRQYAILGDSAYRYAFNGKLHDDNIYGKDNSYDYGMRFYDPRLGRFMSVDPLRMKFPELTPYQYSSNSPIQYIDMDGMEGTNPNNTNGTGESIPASDAAWTPPIQPSLKPNNNSSSSISLQNPIDLTKPYQAPIPPPTFAYTPPPPSFIGPVDMPFDVQMGVQIGNGIVQGLTAEAPGAIFGIVGDAFKVNSVVIGVDAAATSANGVDAAANASSVWSMAPVQRGFKIEEMLGGNLPKNFPVVDKFVNGVATSIKSVDLSAATYQDSKTLYSTLSGYLNKLADFSGRTWGGAVVKNMSAKELLIAVPKGATTEQANVLSQIVDYGKQEGINVTIQTVK